MWQNLLNNFAIDRAAFTGAEIGILQSLREVPGFIAFTIVFVLLFIREQKMAYVSLLMLGLGTFLTGFFPNALALNVPRNPDSENVTVLWNLPAGMNAVNTK